MMPDQERNISGINCIIILEVDRLLMFLDICASFMCYLNLKNVQV